MLLSGMLLPLQTGPGWTRVAAHVNPLAYLVDAERALFAGELGSPTVAWGWAAALVTAAVGLTVGGTGDGPQRRLIHRRPAGPGRRSGCPDGGVAPVDRDAGPA